MPLLGLPLEDGLEHVRQDLNEPEASVFRPVSPAQPIILGSFIGCHRRRYRRPGLVLGLLTTHPSCSDFEGHQTAHSYPHRFVESAIKPTGRHPSLPVQLPQSGSVP